MQMKCSVCTTITPLSQISGICCITETLSTVPLLSFQWCLGFEIQCKIKKTDFKFRNQSNQLVCAEHFPYLWQLNLSLHTYPVHCYFKLTLDWKYIEQFNLVSKCCHSKYSSTLACSLLSSGYQWSWTFFSRHKQRSIPTLQRMSFAQFNPYYNVTYITHAQARIQY